jgi:hypothetical protein
MSDPLITRRCTPPLFTHGQNRLATIFGLAYEENRRLMPTPYWARETKRAVALPELSQRFDDGRQCEATMDSQRSDGKAGRDSRKGAIGGRQAG